MGDKNTSHQRTNVDQASSFSGINTTNPASNACNSEGASETTVTIRDEDVGRTEGRANSGRTGKAEETTGDDNEDMCDENVIKRSRVPDGGWGWMVALGTFIVNTLLFSVPSCFGVLFSGYLLEAGTSSTTTAWIFNIFLVVWHLVAMFINPLCQEFGRRTVGFICSSMCSLSFILSAFSPSVYFLYFSFSVLGGVSLGISLGISYTALPPYFDKRSGMANTLLVAGAPMSQMVFAPLVRYLLDVYSYKGAALIYSAILLNSLIGMSFFHPVKWHLKPPSRGELHALMPPKKNLPSAQASETPQKTSVFEAPTSTPTHRSSHSLQRFTSGSMMSVVSTVSADVASAVLWDETKESTEHTKLGFAKTLWKILTRVAVTTKEDLSVLRQFRALVLCATLMLTQATQFNFMMMLPFVAQAADYSLQDAAWCISLMGATNFVLRLVLSPVSDWKWFSIRFSIILGYCLRGAAIIIASLASELMVFAASGLLFGLGLAASLTMYNLTIVKYMGMEKMKPTFGTLGLATSIGYLVIGPGIGLIRDLTNSYSVILCVMAALDLLSASLWLLMPAAQARDTRMAQRAKAASSTPLP